MATLEIQTNPQKLITPSGKDLLPYLYIFNTNKDDFVIRFDVRNYFKDVFDLDTVKTATAPSVEYIVNLKTKELYAHPEINGQRYYQRTVASDELNEKYPAPVRLLPFTWTSQRNEDLTKSLQTEGYAIGQLILGLIEPLLDKRALKVTQALGNDTKTYNLALKSKYFAQLVENPNVTLGKLMAQAIVKDEVDGLKNAQIVDTFLQLPLAEVIFAIVKWKDVSEENKHIKLDDKAVVRNVLKWSKLVKPTKEYGLDSNRFTSVAGTIANTLQEHNYLTSEITPEEWHCIHTLLENQYYSTPPLTDVLFRRPKATLKAVNSYFPKHMQNLFESKDVMYETVINNIEDYMERAKAGKKLVEKIKANQIISFAVICDEAKAWHEKMRKLTIGQAKRKPNIVFPEPQFKELTIGNHKLKFIPDSYGLVAEGSNMQNCAASYVEDCKNGESIIYQYMSNEDQNIGMVELTRWYKIKQIYGPYNTPIPKEVQNHIGEAVTNFIKEEEEVKVNHIDWASRNGIVLEKDEDDYFDDLFY